MARPPIDQQVTFIYTADLAASAAFFGETLELEQVLDQGPCRIFRIGPDSFLGVCDSRPPPAATPPVTYTIVSPDVDGWHAFLERKGVATEGRPRLSERFNVYSFFFRDPNGYRFEVQAFRDPAWPKPGRR